MGLKPSNLAYKIYRTHLRTCRTFDPSEADYFYVPIYTTCYFWPTLGWADYPLWYTPQSERGY